MPPGEATTRYKGVSHTPSGRYSVRLTAESVTAFVGSLSTAREACHAHDILRLAREHLHGAKKYSAKRLHFPAATYADMGDHIRGCRDMRDAQMLVKRYQDGGVLERLAAASARAGREPALLREPDELEEEEQDLQQQQQQQQQQPQQQQQQQRRQQQPQQGQQLGEAGRRQHQEQRSWQRQAQEAGKRQGGQLQEPHPIRAAEQRLAQESRPRQEQQHLSQKQGPRQQLVPTVTVGCVTYLPFQREVGLFCEQPWRELPRGALRLVTVPRANTQVAAELARIWAAQRSGLPLAAAGSRNPLAIYQAIVSQLQQQDSAADLAQLLLQLQHDGALRRMTKSAAKVAAKEAAKEAAARKVAAAPAGRARGGGHAQQTQQTVQSNGSCARRGRGSSSERPEASTRPQQGLPASKKRRQEQQEQVQPTHLRFDDEAAAVGNPGPVKRCRSEESDEVPQQVVKHEEPEAGTSKKRRRNLEQQQQQQQVQQVQQAQQEVQQALRPPKQLPPQQARQQHSQQHEAGEASVGRKKRLTAGGQQQQQQQQQQQPQQQQAQPPPLPQQQTAEPMRSQQGRQQQAQQAEQGRQQQPGGPAPNGLAAAAAALPPSVPPGAKPWWVLGRLDPLLEAHLELSPAKMNAFREHMWEAEEEERRVLFAALRSCLQAGDAAGARRWVLRCQG